MYFILCIAVQSRKKIPKVQNVELSTFLQEKKLYVLYFSWILFPKFKMQANQSVTDQCHDQPFELQICVIFLKMLYSLLSRGYSVI